MESRRGQKLRRRRREEGGRDQGKERVSSPCRPWSSVDSGVKKLEAKRYKDGEESLLGERVVAWRREGAGRAREGSWWFDSLPGLLLSPA